MDTGAYMLASNGTTKVIVSMPDGTEKDTAAVIRERAVSAESVTLESQLRWSLRHILPHALESGVDCFFHDESKLPSISAFLF